MTTQEVLQGIHDWTNGKIVYDISAAHPDGQGNPTKYADLAAALNGGANIPQSLQKGGMSVKFVRSSDNNSPQYVQYRLMHTLSNSSTTSADFANTANWQGVDDEPTAGSDNLITSGGVYENLFYEIYFEKTNTLPNTFILSDGSFGTQGNFYVTEFKVKKEGDLVVTRTTANSNAYSYVLYDNLGNIASVGPCMGAGIQTIHATANQKLYVGTYNEVINVVSTGNVTIIEAIDAVNNTIEDIQDDVKNDRYTYLNIEYINHLPKTYIKATNGELKSTNLDTFWVDVYKVHGNKPVTITYPNSWGNAGGYCLVKNDQQKVFETMVAGDKTIDITDGDILYVGSYSEASVVNTNNLTVKGTIAQQDVELEDHSERITSLEAQIDDIEGNPLHYNGVWESLGTSITWYNDHTTEAMTKGYQDYVKDEISFDGFVNKGISGGSLSQLAQNINNVATIADYYTIEHGVNDWWLGTPIGTIDDFKNNTGYTTFYGAMRIVLDRLYALNPKAQIILITPRKARGGVLPSHWYEPNNGIYFNEYADAIKEIGKFMSLVVCDWFYESGANETTLGIYSIDGGVHPNAFGNYMLAKLLVCSFKKIVNNV